MPRPNKPRYRSDRDVWFSVVNGRKVVLAHGKSNRSEAARELHRLLGERPGSAHTATDPPFGEIIVAWREEQARRAARGELSPRTRDWYAGLLAGLTGALGDVPCSRIAPAAVSEWLDGHKGRGATSRHHTVTTLRAITRWAVETGRLKVDPLAGLRKPARRQRRELVLSPEQWPVVLECCTSTAFRDLLIVLHGTGARLSEITRLTAADVDLDQGLLTIHQHKTQRHTGKPRFIHASGEAVERLRGAKLKNPVGPIFLNEDGQPWDKNSANCQIRRIRRRSGGRLGREFSAHALRHLYATDALARGVPVSVVSALLGHSSAATVSRWYDHTGGREEELRRAAALVRPTPAPAPASPSPASPPAAAPAPPTPRGTRRGRRQDRPR